MLDENININASSFENVLITGATGFIGSHVAEYFCKRNINVSCFVRENSKIDFLQKLAVKIIYGDITNIQSIEKACQNIDYVVHVAALCKDWGSYEEFYKVNVEGTLNVLRACKKYNVSNIIITGSNSSYGEEDSNEVKNEEYPFNSNYNYFLNGLFPCAMNHYRNTKALCTKEAIKYASKHNQNLTILEPVFVYGEREFSSGFYEYMKVINSNVPFFMGKSSNKFHVIYAKDLAIAYYNAFTKRKAGVNRYLVGNSNADLASKIYSTFCKYLIKKKPAYLPKFIIYPVGFILELLYTIFKSKTPPLLTRGRVNMFYDNNEISADKAKKELGFISRFSLDEGISRTVEWYKENNLI